MIFRVELQGHSGTRIAYAREMRGDDELHATGPALFGATELLRRLLVSSYPDGLGASAIGGLSVSERDRLLAEVYRHHFGDRVTGTAECGRCGKAFELDFSLAELLAELNPQQPADVSGPDQEGVYQLDGGTRFRVPTANDLEAAATRPDPVQALREVTILGSVSEESAQGVERALERLAPPLREELEGACPECETTQQIEFDIQDYLLRTLEREQGWLAREVHVVARAYGWSLQEILFLTRSQRRTFVWLIEGERAARQETLQ